MLDTRQALVDLETTGLNRIIDRVTETGAGSCKTKTLTHRVAHLILNGADSRRIPYPRLFFGQVLVDGHSNLLCELRETLNVGFYDLRKRLGRRFKGFRAIGE